MKQKKSLLSRKAKTLIYASIVALTLATIIQGSLPITPWSAFRLAEKAHLIRPSKILGTESVDSAKQDAVIIAETEEGCLTYAYNHFAFNNVGDLVYKQKAGDLTFMSITLGSQQRNKAKDYLSIILFDDYPQAVRATLVVSPSMESNGELVQMTYTATAKRKADGYFLFQVDWAVSGGVDAYFDSFYLSELVRSSLNAPPRLSSVRAPATLCLYDKHGQLILERDLDIMDP